MTAVAGPPAAAVTDPGLPRRRSGREIFRTAGSVALAAAIFGFAVPHFASYRSAWASMGAMTWAQALLVAVAAIVSMISTWIMICSVLPSIRLREAAVVNLGSNAVANTLPAGGALAMGVSWAMLSSWGVSTAEYVLYTLVSGIWNVFARLGLPVLALLVLVTAARPGPAWSPPPPSAWRCSPPWSSGSVSSCAASRSRSAPAARCSPRSPSSAGWYVGQCPSTSPDHCSASAIGPAP